jgi:hypothetical protein
MPRQRCSTCGTSRMNGVLATRRDDTEELILVHCEVCQRFDTDGEAAIHWTTRFGGTLRYDHRIIIWMPTGEGR